jgi:hypothetical protein
MPLTPQHIEACVDAAADALALPIAPEHRPGVLQFFGLSAAMADLVMGLPLAVHDEPAPVFAPVEPPAGGRA